MERVEATNDFGVALNRALAVGEVLLETLEAEDYDKANEMTDEWGQNILSIFAKEWSDSQIEEHKELIKKLLNLQQHLTNAAENARAVLSKKRMDMNEKNKVAKAYNAAGNSYSN